MNGSKKHLSANTLDVSCTEQTKPIRFTSMIYIGERAAVQGKKHCNKGKSKKRAGVAAVSIGADV